MKIYFLIHLMMISLFACDDLQVFTTMYNKHIRFAKEKNETAYKNLLTQTAIDTINTQVDYFKKHNQDKSFMDIVSESVRTDPLEMETTQHDCIEYGKKSMLIYINRFKTYTNIFAIIYKKEKDRWQIDEFLESESPNGQIESYLQHMKDLLRQ